MSLAGLTAREKEIVQVAVERSKKIFNTKITKLVTKINDQNTKLQRLASTAAHHSLLNVAAHILLFIIKVQPKKKAGPSMAFANKPNTVQNISQHLPWATAATLNDIVTNRNETAHYRTRRHLNVAVTRAAALLADFPHLRVSYPRAADVIDQYGALKYL